MKETSEMLRQDVPRQEEQRTEHSVREWISAFAKEGIENGYGITSGFEAEDFILARLYAEHGKNYDPSDRWITEEQSEYVAEYVQELMREFRRQSLAENLDLQAQAGGFYEEVLSVSPNIFNRLRPPEMLLFAATANRIPEIAGSIGRNLGGEFVYTFNFNSIDSVFEQAFEKADTSEQLDLVLYLRSLADDAASQGWADEGFYRLLAIAERLSKKEDLHPVVRYGARVSFEQGQLVMAAQDQMTAVPTMSEEGRVDVEMDNEKLHGQLITDPAMRGSLVYVAKDAVGRLDHNGLLVGLDRRDLSGLEDLPNREIVDLTQSLINMTEYGKSGQGAAVDVMAALHQLREKDPDFKTVLKELQDDVPSVDEASWKELFNLLEQYHEIEREAKRWESFRYQQAEADAAHVSEEAIAQVWDVFSSHKNLFPDNVSQELEEVFGRESFEERYRGVDRVMHKLSYMREVSTELNLTLAPSLEVWQKHHDGHKDAWSRAKNDIFSHRNNVADEMRELSDKIAKIEEPVEERREEILENASSLISSLQEKKSEGAPVFTDERVVHALRDVTQVRETDVSLLFSSMHHPDIRAQFKEGFGIDIREMTVREQVWFLEFLGKADVKKTGELKKLTTRFGIDAARSFMSAEFGDEFQGHVFQIGEGLDQRVAKEVFQKYGEIAQLAQTEAGELLKEFFVEGKGTPVDAAKIEMELLKRSKRLIEDFAIEVASARAKDEKPDTDELLKKLEQANADTVLFASIFKSAFKGKSGVDFEMIRGVEFESNKAGEISDDDKKKIIGIAKENWESSKLSFYVPETIGKSLSSNEDVTDWVILKRNDDVLSFLRFDKTDTPNHLYLGSVNVNPDMRGAGIGDAFLWKVVEEKAKDNTMELHAEPDSTVSTSYTEKYGFVITGVDVVKTERIVDEKKVPIDVPLLRMYRSDQENETYKGRSESFSMERIRKVAEGGQGLPEDMVARVFDISKGEEEMLDFVRTVTAEGKFVTRYFYDQTDPNRRYLLAEPAQVAREERKAG
ncbi:MAG: GNAT family N-acetyltransferase [bacterium]|nr:GNAT family N-acetyltransferase [bacterium]